MSGQHGDTASLRSALPEAVKFGLMAVGALHVSVSVARVIVWFADAVGI